MAYNLKILHLLSQRPDSTGSGIYIQAMLREAAALGHRNFLVAGVQAEQPAGLDCIDQDQCLFVKFDEVVKSHQPCANVIPAQAGIQYHQVVPDSRLRGNGNNRTLYKTVKFHEADISYPITGMSDVMPYRSTRFCDLSSEDLDEYSASFSKAFKKAVNQFKPDLIHSHHLWIISALARKLFPDIPMVATCHGSDLRQFQNCAHLQSRVLDGCRRLDAIMALSQAQKSDIIRLYQVTPETVHVVGAGYNDALFTPGPKPDSGPVQLIYAGKLSHAKGVPWFLRALSTINAPDWQLHLVGGGSGEEKQTCLRLAEQAGERMQVHGVLQQKDLAGLMRRSHIFVLPSFYEGLPLVVLEALASGCRVIATQLPGVQELLGGIRTEYIDLIKPPRLHNLDQPYPEDENAFEQALAHALSHQIKAAGQNPQIDLAPIRDKITAYTWTGIFAKVRDVYSNCLRNA